MAPCDDSDADGVCDEVDNCAAVPNGPLAQTGQCDSQEDADKDGFGNACDSDFDQDGVTSFTDLGDMLGASSILSPQPEFDLDCDGAASVIDLIRVLDESAVLATPGDYITGGVTIYGDSGLSCADPSIVVPAGYAHLVTTPWGTAAPNKPPTGSACTAP